MTVAIGQVFQANVREILAETEHAETPGAEKTLTYNLAHSAEAWLAMIDGKPAALWGVMPPTLLSDRAYLWLLTTKLCDDHKFMVVRHSQLVIEDLLTRYSVLVGFVSVREERSQNWLKWLGANIGPAEGLRRPFEIRKKVWTP